MGKTDAQREAAKRAKKRKQERRSDASAAVVAEAAASGAITAETIARAINMGAHKRTRLAEPTTYTPVQNLPTQHIASLLNQVKEALRRDNVKEAADILAKRLSPLKECMSPKDFVLIAMSIRPRSDLDSVLRFLEDVTLLVKFSDRNTRRYFVHFSSLVVQEYMAEWSSGYEHHWNAPVEALCQAGVCVRHLTPQPTVQDAAAAGSELRLVGALPIGHLMQRGDVLLLTLEGLETETFLACGTDAEVTEFTQHGEGIVVKLLGAPPNAAAKVIQSGFMCRVDKLANKTTFQRSMEALRLIATVGKDGPFGPFADLLTCGFGIYTRGVVTPEAQLAGELVEKMTSEGEGSPVWSQVNSSQKVAIMSGLQRRCTLIQGPPGSGKTHTAVLLVRAWVESGRTPILCTSNSNVAVDNLVAGCATVGLSVVRLGRPEAIRQDLEAYSLDHIARERTKALSGGNPSLQGDLDPQSMWGHSRAIVSSAQVVCATCTGAASSHLDTISFPCVLIDEAGQVTEPLTLLPLVRPGLHQAVLVGDHRQLPPTVVCKKAERKGLKTPLFERLVKRGVAPALLDVQFRMHPVIAAFPSEQFYGSALKSGVPGSQRPPPTGFAWPVVGVPIAFVPVQGMDKSEGASHFNPEEAARVAETVNNLLSKGKLSPSEIGVISPYAAQVRLLRRKVGGTRLGGGVSGVSWHDLPSLRGVEVGSVDGFQGREKEVIIVSTVRANQFGKIGFLSDPRRLNVTLTRARRGLIIYGNYETLMTDERCWAPWLRWMQKCGLVFGKPPDKLEARSAILELSKVHRGATVELDSLLKGVVTTGACTSLEAGSTPCYSDASFEPAEASRHIRDRAGEPEAEGREERRKAEEEAGTEEAGARGPKQLAGRPATESDWARSFAAAQAAWASLSSNSGAWRESDALSHLRQMADLGFVPSSGSSSASASAMAAAAASAALPHLSSDQRAMQMLEMGWEPPAAPAAPPAPARSGPPTLLESGWDGTGKPPMLRGDWQCPRCGDHQFAKNNQCRQCGAPRPPEHPDPGRGGGGGSEGSAGAAQASAGPKPPGPVAPGLVR
ncbi:unnamed protein product [Prorocentrum cordatum]|uniref:RanBP2-type domain-containing protein n=1 Tax=Prorocentrum cordatum TaxID=2364126 RepID=A0ABN9WQL9_9DINO|nr:unnamed protein product [Polarella glacialis]